MTNVVQDFINEYNVSAEYSQSSKYAFGISVGRIYTNPHLEVIFLSPSQNYYPGTVYEGLSFKLYAKKYSVEKPDAYWAILFDYKNMWYKNVWFLDAYQGEHYYANYLRSETANVFGLDIIRGWELGSSFISSDIYIGIGLRIRNRDINTLRCDVHPYNMNPNPPVGHTNRSQAYPAIVFGLRLGAGYSGK